MLFSIISLEKATDLAQGVNPGYKTKNRFSPERTTDKGDEQYSAVLTGLYNLNDFLPNVNFEPDVPAHWAKYIVLSGLSSNPNEM